MPGRRVQPMAKGTLIAAMNIGRAAEDEFHDWYDTEHLPERQRVPGFLLCQRWIGAQDRNDVVESAEWKKARQSDWTSRLQPHFRDHLRLVLRRYVRGG